MPVTKPQDSEIAHHESGTTYAGPDAIRLFQAIHLVAALRMYIRCKMLPTRGMRAGDLLTLATSFTKKPYNRGSYMVAMVDVQVWVNTMKAAIPTSVNGVQI